METLFYSTGKVALALGVSQERIRDLCSTGAIQAQSTNGGQWRISKDELERLKRDGLAPLARSMPGDSPRPSPAGSRHGHPALLAEPSEQVIEAAEQVVVLENEVKALGLRRQREEGLDWFRERQERQAGRVAAEQDAELERAEAERQQQAQAERESRWLKYALDSVPYEARDEVETELHEQVRAALSQVPLSESGAVVQRIIDAVVTKLLRPWRRTKEIKCVLLEARDRWLPWAAKGFSELTVWQIRAVKAAGAAISELPADTPLAVLRAVAKEAVQQVAAAFAAHQAAEQDASLRESVIRYARLPNGLTEQGRESASRGVAEAIAALPPATARCKLEEAAQKALAPFKEAVTRYQQQQAQAQQEARQQEEAACRERDREREAARKLSAAESRAGCWLLHIFRYLGRLEDRVEFDGYRDQWDTSQKLEEKIRPLLVQELLLRPDMPDKEIPGRVEKLVDRHLDEVLQVPGPATQRQRVLAHPRQVGA